MAHLAFSMKPCGFSCVCFARLSIVLRFFETDFHSGESNEDASSRSIFGLDGSDSFRACSRRRMYALPARHCSAQAMCWTQDHPRCCTLLDQEDLVRTGTEMVPTSCSHLDCRDTVATVGITSHGNCT